MDIGTYVDMLKAELGYEKGVDQDKIDTGNIPLLVDAIGYLNHYMTRLSDDATVYDLKELEKKHMDVLTSVMEYSQAAKSNDMPSLERQILASERKLERLSNLDKELGENARKQYLDETGSILAAEMTSLVYKLTADTMGIRNPFNWAITGGKVNMKILPKLLEYAGRLQKEYTN